MPGNPRAAPDQQRNLIDVLADAMIEHGIPEYIRLTTVLSSWPRTAQMAGPTGAATLYIEPGSPWENGYCESFNSKLRDEFLNGEIFYSLKEAQVLAERWRIYYNTERPTLIVGISPPSANGMANRSFPWSMEKWKANNASHFSTPPTAAAS